MDNSSPLNQPHGYSQSYLFTVRVWPVAMGSAATAIRGEVRYVVGGGVRYFQEWDTLVAYLAEKVQELEGSYELGQEGGQEGGDKTANHVDV